MKNFIILSISALLLAIFIQDIKCNPQLTFSSDWSGGKRELVDSKEASFDSLKSIEKNSEKRAPGWGKRAPGWGKRTLSEDAKINEIISKIKHHEEKATELRNFLFELIEIQKNY